MWIWVNCNANHSQHGGLSYIIHNKSLNCLKIEGAKEEK